MGLERIRDEALFTRLKHKDRQAFIKTYDTHLDDIYRFVFFKVGNREEAEDLTSQAFLKTWDYIQNNSIKDYKTLKSLLYKVARNLVIDQYRKKGQQALSYDNDPSLARIADERQDVRRSVEASIDCGLLREKIFELKDEYREIITLRFLNELSVTEIAQALDKSKGNVRVLIFRALKALKDLAGQE